MPSRIELSGQVFGRLHVLEATSLRSAGGSLMWKCRCECGAKSNVSANALRGGYIKSCGCMQREAARATGYENSTHGHTKSSRSPTYSSWQMMVQRCTNPKRSNFKYYGGQGVKVCDRWRTFGLFLEDMGNRPSVSHCLSRKGDVGNYEPGNVSWKLKVDNIDEMNCRRSA
jgi:hypothetical protein